MAKLVEMDERASIFSQMEENVSPVILINKFSIDPKESDLFLKGWPLESWLAACVQIRGNWLD
jgi:hypothetical protein